MARTRATALTAEAGKQPNASTMVSSVAGFGENLLNLGELQARLTAKELVQIVSRPGPPARLGLAGFSLPWPAYRLCCWELPSSWFPNWQ